MLGDVSLRVGLRERGEGHDLIDRRNGEESMIETRSLCERVSMLRLSIVR